MRGKLLECPVMTAKLMGKEGRERHLSEWDDLVGWEKRQAADLNNIRIITQKWRVKLFNTHRHGTYKWMDEWVRLNKLRTRSTTAHALSHAHTHTHTLVHGVFLWMHFSTVGMAFNIHRYSDFWIGNRLEALPHPTWSSCVSQRRVRRDPEYRNQLPGIRKKLRYKYISKYCERSDRRLSVQKRFLRHVNYPLFSFGHFYMGDVIVISVRLVLSWEHAVWAHRGGDNLLSIPRGHSPIRVYSFVG